MHTANLTNLPPSMVELNLPPFAYKVTKIDGKPFIFDVIRRKYVMITPEEWVRQHVFHWLTGEHQYPKSLIRIETGMHYNQLLKRTDIVVYDREGSPFLLVECKAPHIKLTDNVFDQAIRYNAVLKAKYILVTNGLEHFTFGVETGEAIVLGQIPIYP